MPKSNMALPLFVIFKSNLQIINLLIHFMKKISLSLIIAGFALSSSAQLDLRNQAILRQHQTEGIPTHDVYTKAIQDLNIPTTHITGLIKLNEGCTAEDLEAEGVNVVRVRGDIAMVSMPINEVERISALKQVKTLQLSRKVLPKMDKVRTAMGVDKIHAGTDLPQAYTGKGVIAGIVDQGLDPNHVNFRNPDGSSRINQLTHIYATSATSDGYDVDMYTPENITKFKTDNYDTFHGAHTLGIMAGGYRDTLTVAKGTSALSAKVETDYNPFYGSAYEADIAASCGDLNDMFIALGVEGVLDYAYRNDKPAVVNLSLGSNVGPHDGSEVMSQYLNLAGKEAIICVAAGNEGELPIALNQTFNSEDSVLQTFIKPTYAQVPTSGGTYYNLRYDQLYIYSNDSTEFTVKLIVYNKARGTVTFQHAITSNMNGSAVYYASPNYAQDGDLTNTNFSRAFDGYVGMGSMIDENNGRYYVLIDYFVSDNQTTNANGNYLLGFIVEGKEGQRVDCYCSGLYSSMDSYNQEGWDNGSTNGSISDMACANNVLVVGSYNTRNAWVSLDGKAYNYPGQYTPGYISSFSSYGTLIDGRNLPHICAPGATTISSTNSYYIDSYNVPMSALQGQLIETNRKNYWHQQVGTSMATPAVAGAIALWLEADPTLTIDDVKDIAMSTAVKDSYVSAGDSVQWGAGKFDAYAGLKEVIRRAENDGVESIISDNNSRLMISTTGHNIFEAFIGGATKMKANIYNTSGQLVINKSCKGDQITIDASSLNAGVYIISINGQYNQRIFVK